MLLFAILAALGLICSIAVHLCTFAELDFQGFSQYVWLLHGGVFVVFIPAIFGLRKNRNKKLLATIWNCGPKGMVVLLGFLFLYSFVNFMLVAKLGGGGVPDEIDGAKVIHNHGEIVRYLDDQEFKKQKIYSIRGFSGHWMLFYCASLTILASLIKQDVIKAMERNAEIAPPLEIPEFDAKK
jgi:hypothetical protein